jgi:hypothetical protein
MEETMIPDILYQSDNSSNKPVPTEEIVVYLENFYPERSFGNDGDTYSLFAGTRK